MIFLRLEMEACHGGYQKVANHGRLPTLCWQPSISYFEVEKGA